MKMSQLFTRTRKEAPADEQSKNAQLLIRAGYVYKEMAGVYTFLPLGLRVIDKISSIIKSEMDRIGGVQMKNSVLQKKDAWEKTGRWDDEIVDVWFKTKLQNGTELRLAFTHEEAVTNLMKDFISSYKDLPAYPYDIRTMFRNETRAKSGLMRGREFYWKALYSFSKDEEEHNAFYEKIKQAYINIFERVGLGDKTFLTFASGGTFSKYSHEFQTVSDAGEDIIYIDYDKNLAVNKEVYTDEVLADLGLSKAELKEEKAIEVGNIFSLNTKFSEPIGLRYKNEEGKEVPVIMGSYGIGIGRLMGTIVEELSDEKGIVWPKSVAPFDLHLISLAKNEEAEDLMRELEKAGFEVLFDDREDVSAGEKFADADLMGLPFRVLVSQKSLDAGGYEIKSRSQDDTQILDKEELLDYLKKVYEMEI